MTHYLFQPNVLNLVHWFGVSSNKPIFFIYIPLLNYYINFILSIIFCLSSVDISFALGIFLSCSIVMVSELFYWEFLETIVIFLAILLPRKSPVVSAVFWIILFELVLRESVAELKFKVLLKFKWCFFYLPALAV